MPWVSATSDSRQTLDLDFASWCWAIGPAIGVKGKCCCTWEGDEIWGSAVVCISPPSHSIARLGNRTFKGIRIKGPGFSPPLINS